MPLLLARARDLIGQRPEEVTKMRKIGTRRWGGFPIRDNIVDPLLLALEQLDIPATYDGVRAMLHHHELIDTVEKLRDTGYLKFLKGQGTDRISGVKGFGDGEVFKAYRVLADNVLFAFGYAQGLADTHNLTLVELFNEWRDEQEEGKT